MRNVTWGLDLSTSKLKTAAVALDWSTPGEARVVDVRFPLSASEIPTLMADHRGSTWAVDVPFGWLDLFVSLMTDRHSRPLPAESMPAKPEWDEWRTRKVAQRLTDRFLTDDPRIRTRPLPASFQLLGATAAMWALIEADLVSHDVKVDRAGLAGSVCETYPAAALSAWGFGRKKLTWPELREAFAFLTVDTNFEGQLSRDDVCDAVVCSLAARARDLGITERPSAAALPAARREGWIHVSCESPTLLLRN
ncbi:DUF429 domain-containing protein [Phycicoccus sp. MAQZ13P-2]|uniref:DUF429 domain-containing protein n=1 Tax=Phycicoccus mangrovi TaxID=2840470 RepID=UPI001C0081E0|nr:DUF429 domain-containing protein [Phycicoccus mangrovi]MBT9273627.1 DUF429 domain-containing protein [Phycicoccus mangrovi]